MTRIITFFRNLYYDALIAIGLRKNSVRNGSVDRTTKNR